MAEDNHSNPSVAFRPPAALNEAARAVLASRGRGVTAFFTACWAALVVDPERLLSVLDDHWPEPPKLGRPPKARGGEEETRR